MEIEKKRKIFVRVEGKPGEEVRRGEKESTVRREMKGK